MNELLQGPTRAKGLRVFVWLALAFALSGAAMGADEAEEKKENSDEPKERQSVTQHTVRIGGKEVQYKATAGTLVLKKEDGKARASVFYISYVLNRTDETNQAQYTKRPITFSFNGGPGSSSVWLHLGVLGPRRVRLNEDGTAPPPPYELVDNEYSILDKTDLVFIDPVSTGFSRAAPGAEPKEFHGVQEDIESVADFIRLYTTRNHRWASPKFLVGESYGTTRAAGLAGHLQDRYGMYLNGVMLISVVLDFQTIRFTPGNDLPYVLFLPGYTATAWYHERLSGELQEDLEGALEAAEEFAANDYHVALLKGDRLPDEERERIAAELARLTGLSKEYVRRSNLRVEMSRFGKELLQEEERTIGRFDSRFLGLDRDLISASPEYDPSYAELQGAFTGAMNHYVRAELQFGSDLPYEILTGKVHPWNYGPYQNRYLNLAEPLRQAMTRNPHLKLFVANGYYDLATPYFATDYTLAHLGLHESLKKNVTVAYYEAGHMMYIHQPSLVKMKDDLAQFLDDAVPEPNE